MDHDVAIAIISGGTFVAVIEGIREALTWHRNRKALQEDRDQLSAEERIAEIETETGNLKDMVSALIESQKYLMYERIRYLAQIYISKHKIDIDERRILHQMHDSYHNGLHGNGDLDALMKDIDDLPVE